MNYNSRKLIYVATNIREEFLSKIEYYELLIQNYAMPVCARLACHQASPLKGFLEAMAKEKHKEFEEYRDCYGAAAKMRSDDFSVFLYDPYGDPLPLNQLISAMGNRNVKVMIVVADGLPKPEVPVSVDTKKSEPGFLAEQNSKFERNSPGGQKSLFNGERFEEPAFAADERFEDLGRYNPGLLHRT